MSARESKRSVTDLQRIKRYDTNLLIVLRTLLETTSVSETARRLGSTQPSVSRMLERLRDDLGDLLLVKSSNIMRRTKRAEELRPLLDNILDLLRSVYRSPDGYRLEQENRICVVGANDSLQAIFSAPLIERMRSIAPNARVRLKPLPYPNPMRALVDGEIDIMIAMSDFDDARYRAELLFESSFSCLCAKNNTAVRFPVNIAMLADLPYLDVSHMGVISAITDELYLAAGVKRRTVAMMSSFLAAPAVISDSDMVSLVPNYLRKALSHHPGVKVVPLAKGLLRHSIRLYWHNSTHFDLFLKNVRSMIRAIAKTIRDDIG